jgi:hypothetical protein
MSPAPDLALEALQQRYAAIEQVYAEQNWSEVELQCQGLLAELPTEPGDPLRQRLLLLLGHTQLYGLGNPAAAASFYGAVLAGEPEAVMAELAQQGLAQCGEAAAAPAEEPTPAVIADASVTPAMPWLVELGEPSGNPPLQLEPALARAPFQDPPAPSAVESVQGLDRIEVIDEPEQIAVAQADPERSQTIELNVDPEAMDELSQGLLRVVMPAQG